MVIYGFLEIFKTVIRVAKITVISSFSCLVPHVCRNLEASFMVIYGFLEIYKTVIAKITVRVVVSQTSVTMVSNLQRHVL